MDNIKSNDDLYDMFGDLNDGGLVELEDVNELKIFGNLERDLEVNGF